MTYSLLRVNRKGFERERMLIGVYEQDTKIGKVVKAACIYPFEDDTIKDRCQQLMKSWKNNFLDSQSSPSAIKEKMSDDSELQE